jgi:hypothetical protein
MALNGISTLETKELRQIAKLELAQTKRQQVGTPGYRELRYYDLDLLPTVYSGNDVVDNPNLGGLVQGRPWKTTPNILAGLWRSTYNTGFFGGDPNWFDSQTPLESIAVTDFSIPSPFDYLVEGGGSIQWIGYFRAPHTANYTFKLNPVTDDYSIFWIGDNAITAYTSENANMYSSYGSSHVGSYSISLTAGAYYPIRLQFGNGGNTGSLDFTWEDDYV